MKKTTTYSRLHGLVNGKKQGSAGAWLVLWFILLVPCWGIAQNIVFPPESGVVNLVTDPRYMLRPNDNSTEAATYNSDKIQQAIDDCSGDKPSVSQTLYFPNGTYYVNKKMSLGSITGQATTSQNVTFQGQSRAGTIIRLLDASPGFGEVGATVGVPVLVFFEGTFNNTAAANYVRNLTIDIGADNPNAIGLDFHNNNQGGISDITIKSSDSQRRGNTGLKMNIENTGIGYIQNVRVEGFDYGIQVGAYIIAYVYEDIELEGQRVAGLVNQDKPIQIRRLTSRNAVPAIVNTPVSSTAGPGVGSIVIIDSKLLYTGDPTASVPAINNREGSVFARNLTIDYPVRILDLGVDRSAELPDGGEFSSRGVYDINGLTTTGKSMNLPVKDPPVVPWDEDFNNWAIVDPEANGTADDADAINAAIATGKSTICVRYGNINVNKTIKFPDGHSVKRFLVLGNMKPNSSTLTTVDGNFDPAVKKPVFEIGTGANEALVIEGIRTINGKYFQYIQNNSKKTLILRHSQFKGANRVYRNRYGTDHTPGLLFIEDVASAAQTPYGTTQPGPGYLFDHQEVYARSINPENVNPFMVNQGGKFWVLGFKTEGLGVPFTTTQGGFTEVLGGEVNGVFPDKHLEIINNVESSVSIIASEKARFEDRVRDSIVVETQNGVTKYVLKGVMPQTSKVNKYVASTDIPLYISYSANTPPVATANASQTATVGVAFSYTVNAFTDSETPNSLTYAATGLPASLTLDMSNRVISGTLSTTTGSPYSVTITATDPGGLAASTSFLLTVVGAPVTGNAAGLRIFEIFGGGGTANNSFRNDYIMLANYGCTPVSLDGYSVQYASAGANGAWAKTDLVGTIQPGYLYLVQGFAGGLGNKNLPTPDAKGTINVGPGNGKVALFSNQLVFTGADPQSVAGSGLVDLVGYGSTGDVFRGARGPAGNNSNAIGRSYTAQPVDDNNVDFSARLPNPKNSTSPINPDNPAGFSFSIAVSASSTTVCAPANITLTASGGTSYTFSAGAMQIGTSNQAIVTQSGTYSVTSSNATGCVATASVSVTVNTAPAAPTLTSVSRTVAPSQTPLPLTQFVNATTGTTLSFSGVNGSIPNPPSADISQVGMQSFSVTQTDERGCVSAATDFIITVQQSNTVTPGNATGLRIFEIFGGGGTINSGFKNDYIMLANYGSAAVLLDGYSVQYASAGANGAWAKTDLVGTIQPGYLYLIQGFTGGVGIRNLPTPDATGTINVGPGNGKVALFSNQIVFTGSDPQSVAGSGWVDLVGYGSNGDVFRGSARATGGNNSNAIGRSYTAQPVDDNSVDFSVRLPNPKNSTSPINPDNPPVVTSLTLVASASPTTILTTETTTLSATVSGGASPYSYTFTGPGTITTSGNTATVSGLSAGVQTFTIVVADAYSPTSQTISGTVSVTVNAANTAPVVANALPPQSATVGQAFSYLIPANTFTDNETPSQLSLSVSGLPAGLSFAAPATISGTPSTTVGSPFSVTVTATDPGNLSVSTNFALTVSPVSMTVTPGGPFSIAGVTTVSCTTLSAGARNLRFNPQYAGTTGQPISFSVVNELLPTTAAGPYTLRLYTDNPTITLKATQSGTTGEASFSYNWLVACNGGGNPPTNTAPVVANALPPQSATVGQAFSYLIPANTFTDNETPSQLSLSVSGLPAGLSFAAPATISGTPSTTVGSPFSVTVTATDPGNLSVSTNFALTVSPVSMTVTPGGPFSIAGVTTVSCTTLSAGARNLRFNPQYAGTTGQPISFSVVNELLPTTAAGPYTLRLYTDNPTITLKATQSGTTGEASFSYNWLVACNGGGNPPTNTAPVVANALPPQSATVGQAFSYLIPANTFTDNETPSQLSLSVSGLPAGLSFAAPATISGTPSTTVGSPFSVTVTATDPGNLSVSTNFALTVSPVSMTVTPGGPFSIAGVTTVSCTTLSAGARNLRFNPQYAGTTGQPISFSVVNELLPTTAAGPYTLRLYTDNPTITLKATQSGTTDEASFSYNWLATCGAGNTFSFSGVTDTITSGFTFDGPFVVTAPGARQTAQAGAATETLEVPLSVVLTPNPVPGGQLRAVVRGAAGLPLSMQLLNQHGQVVHQQQWSAADSSQVVEWDISQQAAGLYLLQAQTPGQTKTVKVVRQ